MTEELQITTGIDYNKHDVVTVAIAKIEANIRKKVRDAKAEANRLKAEIDVMEKEIPDIGEKTVPTVMKKQVEILNKALTAAKLGKTEEWLIVYNCHSHRKENSYTLVLKTKDNKSMKTVLNEIYPFNKTQKNLAEKIIECRKRMQEHADYGVEWKAKLNDMDAAERQMRAVVVENELNKTKDGKLLVKLLTDNYEDTIKKISM